MLVFPRTGLALAISLGVAGGVLPGCGHEGPVMISEGGSGAAVPDCKHVAAATACITPGLRAEDCAAGFVHEQNGCYPVRPASACPDGELAFLGEDSCHPIMDCGAAPWGDVVPGSGDVLFVDAGQPGGDGSMASPFADVRDALAAAPAGATIVIAEGDYDAGVVDRPVHLRGRCPDLVRLNLSSDGEFSLAILPDAEGATVAGVQVTAGVAVVARDVVLENLWARDESIVVSELNGFTASATVRRSLVDEASVLVRGEVEVAVEEVVIRATETNALVAALLGDDGGIPEVTVERSVLDGGRLGAIASQSVMTVRASAVLGDSSGGMNAGILCSGFDEDGAYGPAALQVSESTILRYRTFGTSLDACTGNLWRVTIGDAVPLAEVDGIGVYGTGQETSLQVNRLLVDGATFLGVGAHATGQARLSNVMVRGTQPATDGRFGDGVVAENATIVIGDSQILDSARAGLAVFGAEARIEENAFTCNAFDLSVEDLGTAAGALLNHGGNRCGCDAVEPCKAISVGLEVPTPPSL